VRSGYEKRLRTDSRTHGYGRALIKAFRRPADESTRFVRRRLTGSKVRLLGSCCISQVRLDLSFIPSLSVSRKLRNRDRCQDSDDGDNYKKFNKCKPRFVPQP